MRASTATALLLALATSTSDAADSTPGASAQRVHVDPATGAVVAAPVIARPDAQEPAYSTSDEGLYQQLSPVYRGGVMVHLQGRFQSTLRVRLEPGGELVFTHERPEGE